MTQHEAVVRTPTTLMRILIVLFIAWVAYWAINGGLNEIPVPEETATSSHLLLLL